MNFEKKEKIKDEKYYVYFHYYLGSQRYELTTLHVDDFNDLDALFQIYFGTDFTPSVYVLESLVALQFAEDLRKFYFQNDIITTYGVNLFTKFSQTIHPDLWSKISVEVR